MDEHQILKLKTEVKLNSYPINKQKASLFEFESLCNFLNSSFFSSYHVFMVECNNKINELEFKVNNIVKYPFCLSTKTLQEELKREIEKLHHKRVYYNNQLIMLSVKYKVESVDSFKMEFLEWFHTYFDLNHNRLIKCLEELKELK